MDEIEELLKSLEKVPGAEKLAKDLRGKFAAAKKGLDDELDSAKAEAATAKKEAKTHKSTADAYKRDLDAGASGKEEALKKATAERDDWKAKAEKAEAKAGAVLKRSLLQDELGITDPVRRRHATDALMGQLPEDVVVDENGKLVGAAKHVKAFRESAPFYWETTQGAEGEAGATGTAGSASKEKADKGNGGPRPGSGAAPMKQSGAGAKKELSRAEKIAKYGDLLYPDTAAKQGAEGATKH